MFPLDTPSAIGVLARRVAAGVQVHAIATVFAAAIELGRLLGVQRPGQALGLGKGGRCGVEGEAGETAEQGG